jgi:methylphosphotriester-DNA--protein-cysteine methyltransferase
MPEWEEALEVLRRPEEELFQQVEAARLQANSRLYPSNEDPMMAVLLAEAIRRDQEGTATTVMIELLQRHQGLVLAGYANEERAKELRQQIKSGQPFDLSAGWINELPA